MNNSQEITELSRQITNDSSLLANKIAEIAHSSSGGVDPFIFGLSIFILSCFVGYFVVWRVTPALHTPLMAVTNAISGVILIGAIIALGASNELSIISYASFLAIVIASINIFGGFFVTYRMLEMFKK